MAREARRPHHQEPRHGRQEDHFEKNLQEHLRGCEDGHITAEAFDEIVRNHDLRDGRISVKLTRH